MDKNFPYLMKNINLHIQEAQQTPRRINSKRSTLIHIIIEWLEDRKNSESSKRSDSLHKRISSIRLTVDTLSETMEDRRQWDDIFEGLKEKNIN